MSRNAVLFLALGALLLAGLFYVFKPSRQGQGQALPTPQTGPTPLLEQVVREGRTQSGTSVLQLREGQTVRVRVTSDRDDELHVHGYDLQLPLRAGLPGELEFVAEHSGRFEVELHRAELALGALEVLPE